MSFCEGVIKQGVVLATVLETSPLAAVPAPSPVIPPSVVRSPFNTLLIRCCTDFFLPVGQFLLE